MNKDLLRKALTWLEWQVLLFPMVVILLVSFSFICGGSCSAWQWWTAVAIVLALPFCRRKCRAGAYALGLFGLVLLLLYFYALISMDNPAVDNLAYHSPATRLLIEGWNPLSCSTPEAIGSQFNIDPWHMRCFHVLFVQKAVWYFNAAAFFFHGDWLAITLPMAFIVFVGLALSLYNQLDNWPITVRLLMILTLWFVAPHWRLTADAVVGMAGLGLMVTMCRCLELRKFDLVRLVAFSFLMMTAKAPGILACFSFWVVFSLIVLFRQRGAFFVSFRRLACIGVGLVLLALPALVSPYYSSFRDYGHPLYPFATSNPEKHPIHDITATIKLGNADSEMLGPCGDLVNAYISPSLTKAFFNWKLNRSDFCPERIAWIRNATANRGYIRSAPTLPSQRLAVIFTLLCLALLPRFRVMAAMSLIALLSVPSAYYGYLRYTPFLSWAGYFAGFALFVRVLAWLPRWHLVLMVLFGLVVVYPRISYLATFPIQLSCLIDKKIFWRNWTPKKVYSNINLHCLWEFYNEFPVSKIFGLPDDDSVIGINGWKLLAKRMPNLFDTEIVPLKLEDSKDYERTPLGLLVPRESYCPAYEIVKYNKVPNRARRYCGYAEYVFRMMTGGLRKLYLMNHQ